MTKVNKIINGMRSATKPSDYWLTSNMEFPILNVSRSVEQRNNQSVWDHTMSVIDLLTIKNPITLLSGLFHDLGKIYVSPMDDLSLSRFPGHDHRSEEIAVVTLREWGSPDHIIWNVARIVRTHMFDICCTLKEKTVRNFIAEIGPNNIDNWFVLRIADSLSYDAHRQYYNRFIQPFRTAIMSYLSRQPNDEQPKSINPNTIGGMQIKGGDTL